ncbi:MAG: outer membrane lipoprotein carrier protein [Candidatus Tokpelaia sp. JSC161]|jgi:outer membrane lipoprotein-sorting protein|nr:MAG: outer membrane lipoprotein carrier protein [Candidatus Tokpelaia sp. JSC161]
MKFRHTTLIFIILSSYSSAHAQENNSQVHTEAIQAQKVANHFSKIHTMTGDFLQFNSRGERTHGTFYLERPGKIRFIYKDSPLRIISDGQFILVKNTKLNTLNLYPLQKTPLNLLLSDKIDLRNNLIEFKKEARAITIVLNSNNSIIHMIFHPKTYELQQWSMIDQQHIETTIQIINPRTGVRFAQGTFNIDYQHSK